MSSNDIRSRIEALLEGGSFDHRWYYRQHADVRLSGLGPAEHYLLIGQWLGRGANAAEHAQLSKLVGKAESESVDDIRRVAGDNPRPLQRPVPTINSPGWSALVQGNDSKQRRSATS